MELGSITGRNSFSRLTPSIQSEKVEKWGKNSMNFERMETNYIRNYTSKISFLFRGSTSLVGQGLLILEASGLPSHTHTHTHIHTHTHTHAHTHTTLGRSPLDKPQRPLLDNTQHSQETDQFIRRDSNPQSQQVRGRRPTAQTTRQSGLALDKTGRTAFKITKIKFIKNKDSNFE